MDALSHALIAGILFSAPGLTPLIPFAVLGSVLPDADILFLKISDRDPSLYLFTHGGITHSIAGVFFLTLPAYGMVVLLAAAGIIPAGGVAAAGIYGVAAIFAGGLLHLADGSACPGIPFLAPFSDRKYTLGILPGPSLLLAVAALGSVMVVMLQLLPISSAMVIYGSVVIVYLAVRAGMYLVAAVKLHEGKIPSINPFRWLVIREDESSFRVRYYHLLNGYSDEAAFEKFRNTDAHELAGAANMPEVRRFLFYSYCVTAERTGSVLILTDPLREKGYIPYPFHYKRVEVNIG